MGKGSSKSQKRTDCPFCGESVDPRHPRFCNKNPNNPRNKAPKPGKKVESGATVAPQIVADVQNVPPEKLPKFDSPEPSKDASHPTAQDNPLTNAGMGSADAIRPLVDLLFTHLEKKVEEAEHGVRARSGPPAPVPDKDKQALAAIYGMVLDKHLPAAWMAKWGLEVAAVLLTVTLVVPKVFEYRAYFKSKQGAKKVEERKPDEAGLSKGYQLQAAPLSDEQLKNAYEKAVAERRVPA